MARLPRYKLFIPGKLTPVSAKLQAHTLAVSATLSLSPSHIHTHTYTLSPLNSNINFEPLRQLSFPPAPNNAPNCVSHQTQTWFFETPPDTKAKAGGTAPRDGSKDGRLGAT